MGESACCIATALAHSPRFSPTPRRSARARPQVNEKMQVLDKAGGKVVPGLWCIGDANGKMMLAHAASAQVPPPLCSPF